MKIKTLFSAAGLILLLALAPCAYADPVAAPAATPAANAHTSPRDAALSQLPPDKAQLYKDAITQLRTKNNPLRDQVDKLQQDVTAIMTADKFDKSAYLAKNAEIEKTFAQMRSNTAEAIAGVAAQFSADERKILEKMHQNRSAKYQK